MDDFPLLTGATPGLELPNELQLAPPGAAPHQHEHQERDHLHAPSITPPEQGGSAEGSNPLNIPRKGGPSPESHASVCANECVEDFHASSSRHGYVGIAAFARAALHGSEPGPPGPMQHPMQEHRQQMAQAMVGLWVGVYSFLLQVQGKETGSAGTRGSPQPQRQAHRALPVCADCCLWALGGGCRAAPTARASSEAPNCSAQACMASHRRFASPHDSQGHLEYPGGYAQQQPAAPFAASGPAHYEGHMSIDGGPPGPGSGQAGYRQGGQQPMAAGDASQQHDRDYDQFDWLLPEGDKDPLQHQPQAQLQQHHGGQAMEAQPSLQPWQEAYRAAQASTSQEQHGAMGNHMGQDHPMPLQQQQQQGAQAYPHASMGQGRAGTPLAQQHSAPAALPNLPGGPTGWPMLGAWPAYEQKGGKRASRGLCMEFLWAPWC